jgi:hypothetical protein
MSDFSSKLSKNMSLENLTAYTIFNVNMLIFIIVFVICFCILSSSMNSLAFSMTPPPLCTNNIEEFSDNSNNNSNRYLVDNYVFKDKLKFESIPLTSSYNSILFGQAKRYIHQSTETKNPLYILEVYANLYILNGNPYGEKNVSDNKLAKQQYNVYLINTKTNNKMLIDALYKDPDGVYKLKFKSNDVNKFDNYNKIEIVHQYQNKEYTVLTGIFTDN